MHRAALALAESRPHHGLHGAMPRGYASAILSGEARDHSSGGVKYTTHQGSVQRLARSRVVPHQKYLLPELLARLDMDGSGAEFCRRYALP